jgi:hypothetical protein
LFLNFKFFSINFRWEASPSMIRTGTSLCWRILMIGIRMFRNWLNQLANSSRFFAP